ncbi:esterase-like activity of phytase family protein [Actinokineospora iranica]|uniref:Esterase-like activity of phytase n=1 Tax=Actinokineospora iranica TaxID=1271860 RepID=A0A1G6Q362_9PSEU|nr:esterase-like activity of phytase family protein [Actinokineospora iranica]SDC86769.1 Esterase-like activity of phytase [Actinokineospora iranica]
MPVLPRRVLVSVVAGGLVLSLVSLPTAAHARGGDRFQRVDTLSVFHNTAADQHTAAEIAAATPDGRTVVYTDSPGARIGFAHVTGRGELAPAGVLAMPGEPTSVDIRGDLALVAVNTSPSFTAPAGELVVVDIAARVVVARHDLGGQPDSIDLSPDGRHAAIAIENERDEDVDGGAIPQAPAGFLAIVDLVGAPAAWTVRRTELTGLAQVAPEDPEPEYVSVNDRGQVAVTLQENNHIAVVDLPTGAVVRHFSAGTATVSGVDTKTDGRIAPTGTVTAPREPDSIAWLGNGHLATADEGDYLGGTRTWTVFDAETGAVAFSSGAELEDLAIRQGQYPEKRAGKKGVEPEGLAVATYGGHRYAFVSLERANLVAVYQVDDPRAPKLLQGLPTGVAPEGVLPIPATGTLVVSSEEDSAEDGVRSSLTSYRLTGVPSRVALQANQAAPSIVSDGIGFGALSGLSAIPGDACRVVAVTDSAYAPTRVLTIDTAALPARVERELTVTKGGKPVGYDGEGIAARPGGGYWLAAEGDAKKTVNLLVEVDAQGAVVREVPLPAGVAATATGNGFEGVAVVGGHVWVAVQREWKTDIPGQATLARFTPATGEWAFVAYPLDAAPTGAWVGLSELTALNDRTLLVLERDNQRGDAATLKKVYRVDISRVTPAAEGQPKPVLAKRPVRDLIPALQAGGGAVHDKPEGLAVVGEGLFARLVGVVDNDGLDDAPGESVFLRLGFVF